VCINIKTYRDLIDIATSSYFQEYFVIFCKIYPKLWFFIGRECLHKSFSTLLVVEKRLQIRPITLTLKKAMLPKQNRVEEDWVIFLYLKTV